MRISNSMTIIVTVDKTGKMKEVVLREYNEDELYKKASFKNGEGFECRHIWNVSLQNVEYEISLFAKMEGRAGQENKYEFPPPIADVLYFGTCILVNTNRDLKIQEWKDIYDKLMGGFEDLDEISDEEDEDTNLEIGSDGYARDGFVVDEEEEEEEIVIKKKKKTVKQPKEIESNYLDCQSELSEEEYL